MTWARRWMLGIVALALAWAVAVPVPAATQRELSLDEMVALSDEIVVGRVVDSETRWLGEAIVTVTGVEVEEAIQGGAARRLEVTQLGGTAVHPRTGIEMTTTASTHVELRPGDEMLLFVARRPSGIVQIVGAQQGHYPIRRDPGTGTRLLPVGPKRLEASRGPGATAIVPRAITLEEMRQRIRAAVSRRGSPAGGGR